MSKEKEEKKRTSEIEHQEIQEVEHHTPHPEPDMTRNPFDYFTESRNTESVEVSRGTTNK